MSLRYQRCKRNKAAQLRQPKALAGQTNQMWSRDFVANKLFDGRKLRTLTVVDCCNRESLAIYVSQSLKGEHVARVYSAVVAERGKPQTIKSDNASEFISRVMDKWAYERALNLTSAGQESRPTTPWWRA